MGSIPIASTNGINMMPPLVRCIYCHKLITVFTGSYGWDEDGKIIYAHHKCWEELNERKASGESWQLTTYEDDDDTD